MSELTLEQLQRAIAVLPDPGEYIAVNGDTAGLITISHEYPMAVFIIQSVGENGSLRYRWAFSGVLVL